MSMRTANADDYLATDVDDQDVNGLGDDTFSVIDRHSNFDGTFRSDRDLRVEGVVQGTIECQGTLFVAQGANVTAKVEAENITVAGDLNGDIRCRGRLQIMPSGRVRGKVGTETLVINEGAYYEGQLEMASPENRQLGAAPPRPLGSSGFGSPTPLPATAGEPRGATPGTEPGAPSTTFIRRLGGPETPWDNRPQASEDEPDGGDERSSDGT